MNRVIKITFLLFIFFSHIYAEDERRSSDRINFTFDDSGLDTCFYTNEYTFQILKNYLRNSNYGVSDSVYSQSGLMSSLNITSNYNLNNDKMSDFMRYIVTVIPELRYFNVMDNNNIVVWSQQNKRIKEVCLSSTKHSGDFPLNYVQISEIDPIRPGYISGSEISYNMETPSYSSASSTDKDRRYLPFMIKTNLLYDLATAANIELEFPVARKWSIAADFMFPWWQDNNNQHTLRILRGTLTGKYWFKDIDLRAERPKGWYLGAFYSGGKFDVQYDKKGYEGDCYLSGGISTGYAHPVGKHFAMEYSLGAGYFKADYEKYTSISGSDNKFVRRIEKKDDYNYIGLSDLKVSLIWYPSFRKRK